MSSNISVQIDSDAVCGVVQNLFDESTMVKLQTVFAETIDPWTPFLSGRLSGDIIIDKDGVEYAVDYARQKYYGTVYHKEVHPLATSHWDKVAMEQGAMDILESRVKEILIQRAKELYG